jgi:hypothetical protein
VPELEFSISPNPTNGAFTIQLPTSAKASSKIIDAQGRIVFVQSLKQGINVVDESLESGVYFITVETENASGMKRLVIR